MGYKFKPNKSVAKRFKVSKTGKLKRHHSFTSHLMSARPAKRRRHLRRSAILFEGHARNMRQLMGISHYKPAQVEHERSADAREQGAAGATAKAPAREANPTKKASSPKTRGSK